MKKMSEGHNQVEIKIFGAEFVKHLLYFLESAAALNEFLYLLLKSCCIVMFYMRICI